jgi:hypothetical protein
MAKSKWEDMEFFDGQPVLDYGMPFMYICGARNYGKTYWAKKYLINRYLKKGEHFVWVRRYKETLKQMTKGKFWGTVVDEFPDHTFSQKGFDLIIDGVIVGTMVPLTGGENKKGVEFMASTMILDEFLLDESTGDSHYLKNEFRAFLDTAVSVGRRRKEFKVIALSNSTALINPYFEGWGITPNPLQEINLYKKSGIVVAFPPSKNVQEANEEIPYLAAINNVTSYAEYAFNNEFADNNDKLIEQFKQFTKHVYTYIYEGTKYGIWYDDVYNIYFISDKLSPNEVPVTVITLNDLSEEGSYKNYAANNMRENLINARNINTLRFTSIRVRELAFEMLKKLGVY